MTDIACIDYVQFCKRKTSCRAATNDFSGIDLVFHD